MTLLEKARQPKPAGRHARIKVTDETIDLSLAWVRHEIGIAQVTRALGKKSGNGAYCLIARSLAEHVRRHG